jgi:hypothetical protein
VGGQITTRHMVTGTSELQRVRDVTDGFPIAVAKKIVFGGACEYYLAETYVITKTSQCPASMAKRPDPSGAFPEEITDIAEPQPPELLP